MLDIEALRLTDEEHMELIMKWEEEKTVPMKDAVAEAQLAKVLWGIYEWLNRLDINPITELGGERVDLGKYLRDKILAAGITKPDLVLARAIIQALNA